MKRTVTRNNVIVTEQKAKSKLYAGTRRGAQLSEVSVGDTVLFRQDKTDKFFTTFNTTPHKIISGTGNNVVVGSPTGARFARNTTFVMKYEGNGLKQGTFQEEGEIQEAEDDAATSEAMEHTTDTQSPQTKMRGTHR